MKLLVIVGFTVLLSAGGDEFNQLSSTSTVSLENCKQNKVHIEKDTQLMWQDQAYVDVEDGAYTNNYSVGKVGSWNYAMNYCAGLDYQGYADWRLPSADELSHAHNKSGQMFTYHRSEDFWTSTPTTKNKYYVVYTVDAYRYKRNKSKSHYIRCVRCWVPAHDDTLVGTISAEIEKVREDAKNKVSTIY